MAKITSKDSLTVGGELIIDEPNRTFQLVEFGNLNAKEGATWQALYSKFVDLWATATYQDSPFPMNAIDALSGQYEVGVDAGGNYNGWAPADEATRNMLRDGGADEYDALGNKLRTSCGIIGLGALNTGAQVYYQRTPDGPAIDAVFTDQINQMVQVFGDSSNGDFTETGYFRAFCREEGYKYADSTLDDTAKENTGAYIVNVLLANEQDPKVAHTDAQVAVAPYTGITVSYFGVDQTRTINGVDYPFRVIVDGDDKTLEQIYEKVQYLLRQNSDIDQNAGGVIGRTADVLMNFVGDTLETTTGVFIDNVNANDVNRVKFKDQNGFFRENAFAAAGTLGFNSALVGGVYRLMYLTAAGADANYGEANAITVTDSDGNEIAGTITSTAISFTFDYDTNTENGSSGDKAVVLVAINPGSGKFAVNDSVSITRTKGISIAVVAEADRAYA